MTMMQNLAKKGYLSFTKDGVTYVYQPAIDPRRKFARPSSRI